MPSILYTADVDGRCDYISDRFYEYTGRSPGTALTAAGCRHCTLTIVGAFHDSPRKTGKKNYPSSTKSASRVPRVTIVGLHYGTACCPMSLAVRQRGSAPPPISMI